MAPSVVESYRPHHDHTDQTTKSPRSQSNGTQPQSATYPDGSPKSTGQHGPVLSQLYPYSSFPKKVIGPTLWQPSDYQTNPERWTYPFSSAEIAELSEAAENFILSGTPLTKINRSLFPLPTLSVTLDSIRRELLNGKGFVLFKNLPVDEWSREKIAVSYLGIGSYIGHLVAQNGKGHVLGHVKDLGEDSKATDKVRIYRTNARQFFHTDDSDVVGLLCLARAEYGGESDVASAHLVWNILQDEYPDVAELFTKSIWYVDRKGEVSKGQDEWLTTAVYFMELPPEIATDGGSDSDEKPDPAMQRLYSKFDPYYLTSLARFSSVGRIPALSPEQLNAIDVLEKVCHRVKLHMVLDPGDIQFLSNSHVFHARTEYRDYPPESGRLRRHLMRLWLSVPEKEGGWRIPFWDSKEPKRGGIQVDDVAEVARLDAD